MKDVMAPWWSLHSTFTRMSGDKLRKAIQVYIAVSFVMSVMFVVRS